MALKKCLLHMVASLYCGPTVVSHPVISPSCLTHVPRRACLLTAQTYEALGNVFKGEKDVVIAKCDADNHKELGEK